MENPYTVLGALALGLVLITFLRARRPDLSHIPAVGSTSFFASYFTVLRFFRNARDVCEEGYSKYPDRVFRIPNMSQWLVVVTSSNLIDDIRKAPDDQVSFVEAVREVAQSKYTMGAQAHDEEFAARVVRTALTKSIGPQFSEILDELTTAFHDNVPVKDSGWITLPVIPTMMQIVCRTSNRFFVGLPLCREPEYINLNIDYTVDISKAGAFINLFPTFLHPIIGRIVSPYRRHMRLAAKHLEPVLSERIKMEEEYNGKEWPGKPNDLVSWFLDEPAEPSEIETPFFRIMRRILNINFAAIHTSSLSFTHALYHLAAEPKYAQPMREEVEAIVAEEGWTKAAMGRMRKIDSFMRESIRINGFGALGMHRRVLRPITLSDGTYLPTGTLVVVPQHSVHHDASLYVNPKEFDGFRFSRMREGEGEGSKYQFTNVGLDYVPFGSGKHACPGRFFAANELKAMMAHILVNYDVKFEEEGVRPQNEWIGATCIPNRNGKIMFRKRAV